ncbi:ATP-binding protein [Mucilaginibacter sp. RS28]|uniref:ATP-binding protein n=1 Tax=Mucilaginibacter straminoryzae TaxID=2932774 RepID=A0A9X2BAW5_9SPHI|nr:ATP-binding protein [Mucilaginibacter straminoryzae]MCJ8211831.1 ATP-binding protein [Mucilaginibacter straminoryzae]
MGLVNVSYEIRTSEKMSFTMLEDMLTLIKNNVSGHKHIDDVIFKSKYILTEMLTNAIKHDHGSSRIKIEIANNILRFVKTDTGKPLTLPKAGDINGNATIVTADTMHILYTNKQAEKIFFYCKENVDAIVMNHRLPEHFGLLIITKAADEFFYAYNAEEQCNTFSASIYLSD